MGTSMVIFWLGSISLLVVGVWLFCTIEDSVDSLIALVLAVTGFAFAVLITFAYIPIEMPSGLPKIGINSGTYKVAFVYVAEGNVNLGIEEKEGENERLRLYQFPMSAFDGNAVKTDGKELLVVESDGFKKLLLK